MPLRRPPAETADEARAAAWDAGSLTTADGEAEDAPAPRRPAQRRATSPTASDFTSERLLRPKTEVPRSGFRRAVYRLTGGKLNLGPSRAELAERPAASGFRTGRARAPPHPVVTLTAKTATLWTFALAGTLNLVEATVDPEGASWTALRATASVAFAVALVLWVATALRARRRARAGRNS